MQSVDIREAVTGFYSDNTCYRTYSTVGCMDLDPTDEVAVSSAKTYSLCPAVLILTPGSWLEANLFAIAS
jgi:hypothetical protein